MNQKINKIPIIISILLLLLAIPSIFPYGYYTLLRFVVCATAIYLAYISKKLKTLMWLWVMIAIALLFNPIWQIHFSKINWVLIDLITACLFIASLVKLDKKEPTFNIKFIRIILGLLFFVIIVSVVLYCYFLKQKYVP